MRFAPAVQEWFEQAFAAPTAPQRAGWPAIARGESVLLLSPTGSGKTLAAFLWAINRVMFDPAPAPAARCRILYISPLKALAVDVERNLRAPIAGIANVADARGLAYTVPQVAVRTGDTPASERARFQRAPADILVTTPESLYLLLTSNARDALRHVETVIVDEIHALVPTKRGAHLALSLERLEWLCGRRLQRIGLSATQRPLDEVARFLGGTEAAGRRRDASGTAGARTPRPGAGVAGEADSAADATPDADGASSIHAEFEAASETHTFRPVTIVDAQARKTLDLTIEVPVEDMASLAQPVEIPSGPASQGPVRPSIWTAIHPRLLTLIREHRSTLIFVNSRRVAERLAGALNELADEVLVRAHHGSIARAQRLEIEDSLKAGALRGLVATSSLELGIDMGAIDLVVQIEAPPSVASGLQRIGRASHQVGAVSTGIVFPKYRSDLIACAAATRAMHDGHVEATRYPRNPLDILAQQVVAITSMDTWDVDDLLAVVRGAAPFAALTPSVFEGVLDMLAGRYPSDEFAELRPRITWDRVGGTVRGRDGAKRVAIINGGTIPDRGLYPVFLAGGDKGAARVGELDEEMVFESRVGETFLLGASSWRIEDISHDRVVVSPAPGEPGKMPFWKGEATGRPLEFGRAIGALTRKTASMSVPAAIAMLTKHHDLEPGAAENLVRYLHEQKAVTEVLPDDRTIVVERCRDELGDWRVCVLTPFGGRIHAPWAMAASARILDELGISVETMWTDDGFVVRFPETDAAPDVSLLLPPAADVEALVVRQLGATALFAARFRECAARALLLPRRRAGQRTPLWQQRKRATDLLQVASKFGSFPMLLEAYRECLRDQFDMPALVSTLQAIEQRDIRVASIETTAPSPFASSVLFGYVANYLYDGDAPLAERRAQALTIDHAQLRELLGEAELRELLDADAIDSVERQLQHLDPAYHAKSPDGLHDLLLRIGDLTADEIAARTVDGTGRSWMGQLLAERRAVEAVVAGTPRYFAVEDAARCRDALGVPLPPGLPESLLAPAPDPKGNLVQRYARTHGPFTSAECAARFGLSRTVVEEILHRLVAGGRLLEGDFRPGGLQREWCDADVLATIRRRSLARLRHDVEPVEPHVLARLITTWQGVVKPRRGLDALLDAIEHLQGAPLVASLLEREILPARVDGYAASDLDLLIGAGEVVWTGVDPLGDRDGRVALFLADHLAKLWRGPRPDAMSDLGDRERAVLAELSHAGASFFGPLHEALGGGFPNDTVDALWSLVWRGLVTNDSLHALRAYAQPPAREKRKHSTGRAFRSRRTTPAAAEGRWSLTSARITSRASDTTWSAACAQQLLARYGVVTREVTQAEAVSGGFSVVYDVFKSMEERGRVRRGYFTAGVGAMQFAMPAAIDLLRSLRADPEEPQVVMLASTDPANPYGAILKWPRPDVPLAGNGRGPSRSAGTSVVIVNGRLGAFVSRGARQVTSYLPGDEPDRSLVGCHVAEQLARAAQLAFERSAPFVIAEINGAPTGEHPLVPFLLDAGFVRSSLGLHLRRETATTPRHAATRTAPRRSRLVSSPFGPGEA